MTLDNAIYNGVLTRQYHYKTLLKYSEKHRPEWYLKLIADDDLDEFHHILWELPFYKRLYKVKDPSLFDRTSVYIQPFDESLYHSELFKFRVFKYRKNLLKDSYVVEKSILTSADNKELFEEYVEKMMIEKPIKPQNLPQPILLNMD
jgi:hypothetical protein